jgi:hypothetical protein
MNRQKCILVAQDDENDLFLPGIKEYRDMVLGLYQRWWVDTIPTVPSA